MNSFSLLKIIIPTLKHKLIQPHLDAHSPPRPPNPLPTLPELGLNLYPSSAAKMLAFSEAAFKAPVEEGEAKAPVEEGEAKAADQEETCQSTCSFPQSDHNLQKNIIDNRVKSLQYEANSPCEDTLACDQLKHLDAFAISVFDGHGGAELAEYCRSKIHSFIDSYLFERLSSFASVGEAIKESLRASYLRLEETFFATYEQQLKMGNKRIRSVGTCALTAVVHNDLVYLANAGDSQAVFLVSEESGIRSVKGNERLSVNSRSERERLEREWTERDEEIVSEEGGVFYLKGRLQPTRTIGDYYLKKEQHFQGPGEFKGPYLTCLPDITEHRITASHRYLVVASDGVWDALSKSQVAEALLRQRQIDLSKTCYDLEQSKTCYDLEQEQPPYLSSVVGGVLQRASEMSGLGVSELKALPCGPRRNYHDDITLAVVNLQQQCS